MRSETQAASQSVKTKGLMPPAKRGARLGARTQHAVPLANPSGAETLPGDGQMWPENHLSHAVTEHEIGAMALLETIQSLPQSGEVNQVDDDNQSVADLAATIASLIQLQRQRRFCIVSQSRCDRSVESFIAKLIGMGPIAAEGATQAEKLAASKARKAVFAQASAVRKAVEKGGEVQSHRGNQKRTDLSAAYPLILLSAAARNGLDKHRTETEKQMRKLARTLPAWSFVETVAGFGDLGLAIVVGETGDLAGYATKDRVWKRLGLAVIKGERQRRVANADAALEHGYNPKRRAEIWSLADSMFKHQWRGAKDDAPAHAVGPYGEVYAARKAHTVNREGWEAARRDNDARRIMTKFLIENLWRAWNGKRALIPTQLGTARQDIDGAGDE